MATLFLEDGTVRHLEPVSPAEGFKFKGELYDILDCDRIEAVPFPDNTMLLVDEEGKLSGKGINHAATALWYGYYGNTDIVVGHALHCRRDELK